MEGMAAEALTQAAEHRGGAVHVLRLFALSTGFVFRSKHTLRMSGDFHTPSLAYTSMIDLAGAILGTTLSQGFPKPWFAILLSRPSWRSRPSPSTRWTPWATSCR